MAAGRENSRIVRGPEAILAALLLALSLFVAPLLADEGVGDWEFSNLDGEAVSLDAFQGQVVLLNLWAVWCSPCIIEIPHLVRLQPELETLGATVIGLAVDSGSARAIRSFWVDRLEIDPVYPLWQGSVAQAGERFGAKTFPTTLIIDREGRIVEHLLGLQTGEELLDAVKPHL